MGVWPRLKAEPEFESCSYPTSCPSAMDGLYELGIFPPKFREALICRRAEMDPSDRTRDAHPPRRGRRVMRDRERADG